MVSNKANMNKAYLKRFQVKYMHMQARKINYQAVMHRTIWNENKHNTLKTCYVVTFTNWYKDIVAQITSYVIKIY